MEWQELSQVSQAANWSASCQLRFFKYSTTLRSLEVVVSSVWMASDKYGQGFDELHCSLFTHYWLIWTETPMKSLITQQKNERDQYQANLMAQAWSIKKLLYDIKNTDLLWKTAGKSEQASCTLGGEG